MDLRLKDYARKEGREWYEILRNHVKEKPEKKVNRIKMWTVWQKLINIVF